MSAARGRLQLSIARTTRICAAVLAFYASLPGSVVQGRPTYLKVFKTSYEQEYRNSPETISCTVCHVGEKKQNRNNYGDAIANTTESKNEKDAVKLEKTLREVEKLPSAIPGKTFGDLIREGRLPGSK